MQFSFIRKIKCSFKDCEEILEPNMVVIATDSPTLLKASNLIGQFARFYCDDHMDFIRSKHQMKQADKLKKILENPEKGFQKFYGDSGR